VLVLVAQAASRRTAALIALVLGLAAPALARAQASAPSHPRTAAEKAWDEGNLERARLAYLAELAQRRRDDAAWFNAGAAALASGDVETAQSALSHAAASLDPDIRFRALYNLGLLALRRADSDSGRRDAHLGDAERAYREALLLKPRHLPAKWNLELAVRRRGGGSTRTPPRPLVAALEAGRLLVAVGTGAVPPEAAGPAN